MEKSQPIVIIAENQSSVWSGSAELFNAQNVVGGGEYEKTGETEILTEKYHNESSVEVKQTTEYGGNPYIEFDVGDEGESFVVGKEVVIKVNGQPKIGVVQEFDDGQGGTIKGFGNPYLFNPTMYQDNGLDYFAFYESGAVIGNYISGHINDGASTFTFTLNGSSRSVEVDSNGDWIYEIPEGETITSLNASFSNKTNLVSVDLSQIDVTSINSCSQIFNGCTSLSSVVFGRNFGISCTDMSAMFQNCSSITNIDLTNINSSNAENLSAMFQNCSSIEHLDIRNLSTSKATDIRSMFNGCSNLIDILGIENLDVSKVKYSQCLFQNCTNLETLNISNWTLKNQDAQSVRYSIFEGCTNLKTIIAKNLFAENVSSLPSIFKDCNSLIYIDAENWITTDCTSFSNFIPNLSTIKIDYKSGQWNPNIITAFPNVTWNNVE